MVGPVIPPFAIEICGKFNNRHVTFDGLRSSFDDLSDKWRYSPSVVCANTFACN